jgi:hypothetical protein
MGTALTKRKTDKTRNMDSKVHLFAASHSAFNVNSVSRHASSHQVIAEMLLSVSQGPMKPPPPPQAG